LPPAGWSESLPPVAYAGPDLVDPAYRECRYVEGFDRWGNVRTIKVCNVVSG